MMRLLDRIFKKNKQPAFCLEKEVGEYMLNLPRCSSKVVVVSPKHGETHYTCEIIADAVMLLPWAEDHAKSISGGGDGARKTLPIWLRGADLTDSSLTYIPVPMYEAIRAWADDLLNKDIASVFCTECQCVVDNIEKKVIDKKRMSPGWSFWIDIWTCPQGHPLRYEEHVLHLFFTKEYLARKRTEAAADSEQLDEKGRGQ